MTSAIDVLPVANGFCHSFYTLEVSTNLPTGVPGRLQRFTSRSGDLLITEIFAGRITRTSNIPQ